MTGPVANDGRAPLMQLDLTETIEADRYPYSPGIRVSCARSLAKFGEMTPQPPPTARPPVGR